MNNLVYILKAIPLIAFFVILQLTSNLAIAQTTITINSSVPVQGDKCYTQENCSDGYTRYKANKGAQCDLVGLDTNGNLIIKNNGVCSQEGRCTPP